jgi:hypothetical protein
MIFNLQLLQEVLGNKEATELLSSSRSQTQGRITGQSVILYGNNALQEEIKALKQRLSELGEEVATVYNAYDRTMAELRRCRDGARDQDVMVSMKPPKIALKTLTLLVWRAEKGFSRQEIDVTHGVGHVAKLGQGRVSLEPRRDTEEDGDETRRNDLGKTQK